MKISSFFKGGFREIFGITIFAHLITKIHSYSPLGKEIKILPLKKGETNFPLCTKRGFRGIFNCRTPLRGWKTPPIVVIDQQITIGGTFQSRSLLNI